MCCFKLCEKSFVFLNNCSCVIFFSFFFVWRGSGKCLQGALEDAMKTQHHQLLSFILVLFKVTKRQKKKEAADSSVSLTSPASDVANKTRSSPEQREENLDKPASDVVGIESPHTSLNSSVDVKSSMILEQTDASNTLGVKATSPVQSKPNLVILEKNEADQLVPSSSKSKPELKSSLTVGPDSKPDLKPMSTVPSAVPNSKPAKKRKSRLAANFGPRS